MSHPQFVALCIPRDGAWERVPCWLSAFPGDPFLSVCCQGGTMSACTVTSSILCLVHPWDVCELYLPWQAFSPSSLSHCHQLSSVWWSLRLRPLLGMSDSCKYLSALPRSSNFVQFALHHKVSGQLYALSPKSEILTGRGWLSLFITLSNHNHCLAAPSVWLSDKKGAGLHGAPGGRQRVNLKAKKLGQLFSTKWILTFPYAHTETEP